MNDLFQLLGNLLRAHVPARLLWCGLVMAGSTWLLCRLILWRTPEDRPLTQRDLALRAGGAACLPAALLSGVAWGLQAHFKGLAAALGIPLGLPLALVLGSYGACWLGVLAWLLRHHREPPPPLEARAFQPPAGAVERLAAKRREREG